MGRVYCYVNYVKGVKLSMGSKNKIDVKYVVNNISPLALVGAFFLLAFFVYILHNLPLSSTYEPSFYTGIPSRYFLFLSISFSLFAFSLWLSRNFSGKYKRQVLLLYIMLYIMLLIFVLSSLWIIKYGRFYGIGDPYIHLTEIRSILYEGHVNIDQNFYPSLHIFTAMLVEITNINASVLYMYLYPLVACLFGISILLLGKFVLSDNLDYLLLFTIINPIILDIGSSVVPYLFASLFLPLMFYIFIKGKKEGYKSRLFLLLLIYSLFLVISHLQVAIVYIISVLFMYLVLTFLEKQLRMNRTKNSHDLSPSIVKNVFIIYIIYLGTVLSFWVIHAYYLSRIAVSASIKIFNFLIGNVSIESIEQTRISLRSPIDFILKRIILLSETFLVAIIVVFIIYKTIAHLRSNNRNIITNMYVYLFVLSIYIFVNGFLYVFMMKSISTEFGIHGRFIYLASLVYSVYLTYGIAKFLTLIRKPKSKQIISLLIMLLVVSFFIIGVLVKYPSPSLGYYSKYTTTNVITGTMWGYSHIDLESSKIMGGGDHFESLVIYLYGKDSAYFRAMYGSTNGLLKFLGYNPENYEHRGIHEKYIASGKIEYIYYEPLMEYFLANPKYASSIVTVNKSELNRKGNLIIIYDNLGMTVYKVQ